MFLYNKPSNLEKVNQFPPKYKLPKFSKHGKVKEALKMNS